MRPGTGRTIYAFELILGQIIAVRPILNSELDHRACEKKSGHARFIINRASALVIQRNNTVGTN
jgi:hypothetical protein